MIAQGRTFELHPSLQALKLEPERLEAWLSPDPSSEGEALGRVARPHRLKQRGHSVLDARSGVWCKLGDTR